MKSEHDKTISALREMRLLKDLRDSTTASLAEACHSKFLEEDELIWREGAPANTIIAIRQGLVEISKVSRSGENVTLGLFGPGDIAGLPATLSWGSYPADARVISKNAEILFISGDAMKRLIASSHDLSDAVRHAMANHTRILAEKIDVLTAGEVEERLSQLFDHLIRRFGVSIAADKITLPVRLSREQISKIIHARIETVIRTMSRWQKLGAIRTTKHGFEFFGKLPKLKKGE